MKCISVIINSKTHAEIKENLENNRDIMRNDFNLKVKEKMIKVEKANKKMMKRSICEEFSCICTEKSAITFRSQNQNKDFGKLLLKKRRIHKCYKVQTSAISKIKNLRQPKKKW